MFLDLKDLGTGKVYRVEEKGALLGREPGSDILLEDPKIAPKHARIYVDKNRFYIEDLKGEEGVVVYGKRISAPFELRLVARFSVADHKFEVTHIDVPRPSPNTHIGPAPTGPSTFAAPAAS
jgi:pSer/pThr/pTyr-binding forkhead associated (FHA) protein